MPPKAKPDTAAYQKLKKDIKEGTIGTLYVFHGEEAYLRDFYLGQLKKKLLPAGMEEFNLHTLSGKEFDVKTLAQLVDCLPMMSERTLIVVNDYDIYKGDKDALAAVLRLRLPGVCLRSHRVQGRRPHQAGRPAQGEGKRGALQPPGAGGSGGLDLPPLQGHGPRHRHRGRQVPDLPVRRSDEQPDLRDRENRFLRRPPPGDPAGYRRRGHPPAGRGGVPDDRRHRRRELRQGGGGAGGAAPHASCWRCWASSSASSTPPAWPSSTERACPISWSCGACARPTRRSGSCSPPGAFPCPGAAGRCSAAARPIWP